MHSRFFVGVASLLVLGSVFVASSNAQDPVEIWLSDDGTAADLNSFPPPSGMGSFDIFIRAPVRVAGVSIDIMEMGGVIDLVDAVLENPSSSLDQPRWTIALDGMPSADSGNSQITAIEGGAFIGLSSQGIGPETAADDGAFDAGLGAFKFATVNYVATSGIGDSRLILKVGRNIIGFDDPANAAPINLGIADGPVPNVAGMTGQIIDGIFPIPEPASLALISLAILGLVGVTRRR